jgi:hypothetical protein
VVLKIFKDYQLFNQSEAMAAIFKKRSIQKVSHQSLVQFDPVVVEKINMRKVNADR